MQCLRAGLYEEILNRFQDHKARSAEDLAAWIGAHSFMGHVEDAIELMRLHEAKLPVPLRIESRFYLGVALTRISRLQAAKELFKKNSRDAKRTGQAKAFAAQGLGFYSYFIGKFQLAAKRARVARRLSLLSNTPFIRYLATDLLGHSLVQNGKLAEGLRLMKNAKDLARKTGNSNFASAFAAAAIIYEAEAGWRPGSIVQEMEEALRGIQIRDSYTHCNLALEYARQLTLRGRWDDAKNLLNRESATIYGFGNRRQELVLQLRLAEVSLRQGDFFATEHFLRAGKRCLHRVADRSFEIRLLGLERKSYLAQAKPVPVALTERLLHLSHEHSTSINRQILFRDKLGPDPAVSEAEDPLGQIFQLSQRDRDAACDKALALGYLGLWPSFQGLTPGTRHFILLRDLRSFVITSPSGTYFRQKALTQHQLGLLQCLHRGEGSKENLIVQLWGYSYHPLRHDPILYTAINKLRRCLEPCGDWIINTDWRWQLTPEVQWHFPGDTDASDPIPSQLRNTIELNTRQIQAVREIHHHGLWTVKLYGKRYGISPMTAFRDLHHLHKLGFLARIGKGRSTRYYLEEKQ